MGARSSACSGSRTGSTAATRRPATPSAPAEAHLLWYPYAAMDLAAFANTVLSLFVIVDPVGCLPVFAAITRRKSREQRRATIGRAVTIALCVLVVFALAGHWMLAYLGIGMPAVRIAGGILLFLIGIEMLYGRVTQTSTSAGEEEEAVEKDDVSVTPLAIPLLAGPGSI